MEVYKMTSELKLLAKNSVKLRIPQSIHDCCLAGDYLFVFECPVKFNVWKLLKGYHALNCFSMDYDYGKVNAYIFSKDTL
jgi:carotenoid cleavage dioxygenase-like enzyme